MWVRFILETSQEIRDSSRSMTMFFRLLLTESSFGRKLIVRRFDIQLAGADKQSNKYG